MKLYLLDAGGAGLIFVAIGVALIFMIIAILVEAFVMMGFKYHAFKKSLVDSTIVNVASLVAGLLLVSSSEDVFNISTTGGFLLLFGITVVIEFIGLYLLNKHQSLGKTALVCVTMNMITYFILYLFIRSDF
ncbi:MAG: hypothetical protein ABIT05_10570 [Chitinophagaceae bacterium]